MGEVGKRNVYAFQNLCHIHQILVLILHNFIFNLFYMPHLCFDNKRENINSYTSDQFSTAITQIWFLFYKHVILLSFISYLS